MRELRHKHAAAAGPYRWEGQTLVIPNKLVELTFSIFESYFARGVEVCCFWYGVHVSGTESAARAVVIPQQINRPYNFEVPSDGIAAMSIATRERGWKNLAQLHTHPDIDVEHSDYDDRQVNSRRALSIVIPNYGTRQEEWLNGAAVHEFQNDYWHQLSFSDAKRRVCIVESGESEIVDIR